MYGGIGAQLMHDPRCRCIAEHPVDLDAADLKTCKQGGKGVAASHALFIPVHRFGGVSQRGCLNRQGLLNCMSRDKPCSAIHRGNGTDDRSQRNDSDGADQLLPRIE